MSKLPTKIEIPKRGKECSATGKVFEPGMQIYSIVLLDEEENFVRKDFLASYWKTADKEDLLEQSWGHWKMRIPEAASKRVLTKHERAVKELEDLLDEDNTEAQMLAFLFAQYLKRCNHLSICYPKEKHRTKGIMYFTVPESGEVFAIPKFDLKKEQIQSLEKALQEKVELVNQAPEEVES